MEELVFESQRIPSFRYRTVRTRRCRTRVGWKVGTRTGRERTETWNQLLQREEEGGGEEMDDLTFESSRFSLGNNWNGKGL